MNAGLLLPILPLLKEGAVMVAKILVVLALAVWLKQLGYQEGFKARDAIAQTEKATAADARTKALLQNVANARENDLQTIARLERSNALQTALAKRLTARLTEQEQTPYTATQENPSEQTPLPPLLGQSVLDDGTVRLLNAARRGDRDPESGSAAERGDAEGGAFAATAPYVTGRALAENDLEVVRLYHQLATRHDQLVDWVNQQCTRQQPQPSNEPN